MIEAKKSRKIRRFWYELTFQKLHGSGAKNLGDCFLAVVVVVVLFIYLQEECLLFFPFWKQSSIFNTRLKSKFKWFVNCGFNIQILTWLWVFSGSWFSSIFTILLLVKLMPEVTGLLPLIYVTCCGKSDQPLLNAVSKRS